MTTGSRTVISVIDDDEAIRRALGRLLKSIGYEARLFSSAQDFLDYNTLGDSLLILDIQMPEMDGFELLDVLSASGREPPVILMTGHESPEARAKALDMGVVAFLEKPFEDRSLLEAIQAGIPLISKSAPLRGQPPCGL